MTVAVAAALVAVITSYWAGRVRLGRWLLSWAEDRATGSHGPAWWAAQAVGLVAVAWMLTVHPRRTAANRRSWREARNQQRSPAMEIPRVRRAPAPPFDPDWAAKRGATTPGEESTP